MKFIIAGCVRNSEVYIKHVFENIKTICSIINVEKIVVAYDPSSDETLYELMKQKKHSPIDIQLLINKKPLTPHRTQNICNARNELLQYIYGYTPKIDKFIMMDFDDVCSKPINVEVFKKSLDLDADCITFNNENYYDFWALSLDNFEFSAWHLTRPRTYLNLSRNYLIKKILASEKEYIECDSAFNGLGIYKLDKFKDCKYQSLMDHNYYNQDKLDYIKKTYNLDIDITQDPYDCEHRIYHFMAKKMNNARIIIYKQFLFPVYTGPHTGFID